MSTHVPGSTQAEMSIYAIITYRYLPVLQWVPVYPAAHKQRSPCTPSLFIDIYQFCIEYQCTRKHTNTSVYLRHHNTYICTCLTVSTRVPGSTPTRISSHVIIAYIFTCLAVSTRVPGSTQAQISIYAIITYRYLPVLHWVPAYPEAHQHECIFTPS